MLDFWKVEGNGNDFILIWDRKNLNYQNLAKKLCKRRFSIGADGLIVISPSNIADFKMRIFNPDGSEAEYCGNASRCVAKFLYIYDYVNDEFSLETLAGIKRCRVHSLNKIEVEVGKVLFDRKNIPVKGSGPLLEERLEDIVISAVNVGVPHAIIFVDKFDKNQLIKIAKKIRFHQIFPKGTNVNFVKILDKDRIRVLTYERGVENFTLSCGSGNVASACIAYKLGYCNDEVKVLTDGGELYVKIDKNWNAKMIGNARILYRGLYIFQ